MSEARCKAAIGEISPLHSLTGRSADHEFTLESNLGPMTFKEGTKTGNKTQDRPKRINHIAYDSLPWAQGVRGSNPRAPTNVLGYFAQVIALTTPRCAR